MTDAAIIEPAAAQMKQFAGKPSDERQTPEWLYAALDVEFNFSWDLAARAENCRAFRLEWIDGIEHRERFYFGPDHERLYFRNGLTAPWHRILPAGSAGWLNPPYSGGQTLHWCAKAEAEALHGITTVMLIQADPSTEYWHRYMLTGERRTLKKRLSFEGAPLDKKGRLNSAKTGHVLRIFRPTHRYWSFA